VMLSNCKVKQLSLFGDAALDGGSEAVNHFNQNLER
jgi:hypothetical protein